MAIFLASNSFLTRYFSIIQYQYCFVFIAQKWNSETTLMIALHDVWRKFCEHSLVPSRVLSSSWQVSFVNVFINVFFSNKKPEKGFLVWR